MRSGYARPPTPSACDAPSAPTASFSAAAPALPAAPSALGAATGAGDTRLRISAVYDMPMTISI
jgi:hypothetical protein